MTWQVFRSARGVGWTSRAVILAGGALLLAAAAAGLSGASASGGSAPPRRATVAAVTSFAGDGPPGFWYGTDSRAITIPGSAPYRVPVVGGNYGGYVGMIGNWAHREGCGGTIVWSWSNSLQANKNFFSYHKGVGTAVYWFMGGPGVDPHYNGTTSEAYAWGRKQAAWTLADVWAMARIHHRRVPYPVVFMDVEIPGHAPAYTPADDNGWNSVYTSPCSGKVKIGYIPAAVDRAVINGFAAYLTRHSARKAGVYSAPDIWRSIFGTGSASRIPNTYEWTYEPFTSSLRHRPYAWCLRGTTTCARFFGGQSASSKYALMWQWSGGGGSYNGYGDFDQIDGRRTP